MRFCLGALAVLACWMWLISRRSWNDTPVRHRLALFALMVVAGIFAQKGQQSGVSHFPVQSDLPLTCSPLAQLDADSETLACQRDLQEDYANLERQLQRADGSCFLSVTNQIEDLSFTGFSRGATSVLARVSWPNGAAEGGEVLVFLACDSLHEGRYRVVGQTMIGSEEEEVVVEISLSWLPGDSDVSSFLRVCVWTDADEDGLPDVVESLCLGTSPENPDTDEDGICDGDELRFGFDPCQPDADRDLDQDGMPDIEELVLGMMPGAVDTDGDGLPDGVEWAAGLNPAQSDSDGDGIADAAALALSAYGLAPATPPPPVRGSDVWIDPPGDDYEISGSHSITVTFDPETEDVGQSVFGVGWPGGTTTSDTLAYTVADRGTNSRLSISASGASFRALKAGRYHFQLAADDHATLSLGNGFSVSADWSLENRTGTGEPGSLILVPGDVLPITLSSSNTGGPGKVELLEFGRRTALASPSVNAYFTSSRIECTGCVHAGVKAKPTLAGQSPVVIVVEGGELGGQLTITPEATSQVEWLAWLESPRRMLSPTELTIRVPAGERKVVVGLCAGKTPGIARVTGEFVENRTNRTISQTATLMVEQPVAKLKSVPVIRFDHDAESFEHDALTIKKDKLHPVNGTLGEWRPEKQVNDPVCYIAGTRSVRIKARFELDKCVDTNMTIRLTSQGFPCSDFAPVSVPFCCGKSKEVVFEAQRAVGNAVSRGDATLVWQADGAEESVTTGPHKCYVILDEPQRPWRSGSRSRPRPGELVWASALDVSCVAASGETTKAGALSKVTRHLFSNMGFTYDTVEGASNFLQSSAIPPIASDKFALSDYIRGNVQVNCYDQAYGVMTLATCLGIAAESHYTEPFGYIKKTNLVGISDLCNNPFFTNEGNCQDKVCEDTTHTRSSFGRHMYVLYEGRAFDACAGPQLGAHDKESYLREVIDTSGSFGGSSCLESTRTEDRRCTNELQLR